MRDSETDDADLMTDEARAPLHFHTAERGATGGSRIDRPCREFHPDEARAMGRCYVHAEPLTYSGAMCPVCASEAPSSDEQTIARLRQALAVATHRPHDRNGPPDPPSGWPTCSGCGAIIEYSAERRRRTVTDEARAGWLRSLRLHWQEHGPEPSLADYLHDPDEALAWFDRPMTDEARAGEPRLINAFELAQNIEHEMVRAAPPKVEGGSEARRQWLADVLAVQMAFHESGVGIEFTRAFDDNPFSEKAP